MEGLLRKIVWGVVGIAMAGSAQKAWVAPDAFGVAASERLVHPGISLTDIMPAGFDRTIGAWDWLDSDRVVFTHWEWKPPAKPSGSIWILEGIRTGDKTKITHRRYFAGSLREPLGVKVVQGEVYVVVKFALLKLVDANRDGTAEDTVQVVQFPHKQEPAETWNHYSMDLKYRDGFFYVALPSETVSAGYPGYPVMPSRGTVAKIDPARKTLEYLVTGLRTPDGLGWGPEQSLFVTDNQGAWLPSSKLIHVTGKRFFGLQPIESGDPSLVESPPAVWMPHGEAASSPTQPLLLESGPYAGQMLVGDNELGFLNRVFLEKVKGEYQGAVFHFTGGLTCGTHRLLPGAAGEVFLGGLGSPINSWNVRDQYVGLQRLRFTSTPFLEVAEIHSRVDGFTLRFTRPVGPGAGNVEHYRLRHWRYQPTKGYGGPKLESADLAVQSIRIDASRTWAHLVVPGLKAGRVVNFQFHKDIQSSEGLSIWTGEAWYTLNQISTEAGGPVALRHPAAGGAADARPMLRGGSGFAVKIPGQGIREVTLSSLDGRRARKLVPDADGFAALPEREARRGLHILGWIDGAGATHRMRLIFP